MAQLDNARKPRPVPRHTRPSPHGRSPWPLRWLLDAISYFDSRGSPASCEQKLFCPQFFNPIPQFSGLLEFKLLGGFAHLHFEFRDENIELFLIFEIR